METTKRKPVLSHRSSIDEESAIEEPDVEEARKGLLKAMVMHKVAPMFTSGPMDFCDESNRSSAASSMFASMIQSDNNNDADQEENTKSSVSDRCERASLTQSERAYLARLLQSADSQTIRRASVRLSDENLFPLEQEGRDAPPPPPVLNHHRRDSSVQQELFRLHERGSVKPSVLLRRMSSRTASTAIGTGEKKDEDDLLWKNQEGQNESKIEDCEPEGKTLSDPFLDVHSWLDGNQGIEVNDDGAPMAAHSPPFSILGTAADDASCYPHVLSPPLMEGIQAFMPESLSEMHFWLKYSLVRDGPGLIKLLRNVRGSVHTVLAIETTEGFVFGSFTSRPWRLSSGRYFGSKESFLWRMRNSRCTPCQSAVEQAAMEGELEVFPYNQSNNAVQQCNRDGISLGKDELKESDAKTGKHYGAALLLDKSLTHGTTSTSETFANPCLTMVAMRGAEFKVANLEVWTMTPYDTVKEAEEEELNMLFFEETHDRERAKLDLVGILLGSPYGQVHT